MSLNRIFYQQLIIAFFEYLSIRLFVILILNILIRIVIYIGYNNFLFLFLFISERAVAQITVIYRVNIKNVYT